MDTKPNTGHIWLWGLVLAGIGIAIVIAGIAIDSIMRAAAADETKTILQIISTSGFWWNPLLDFIKTIGLALVAMGALNVILDLPGWTRYFRAQLQEVVLDDSYLRTLGEDRLKLLVPKIAKAMFNDESLDREGGFVRYFMDHILARLGEPYRENVTVEVYVQDVNANHLRVVDRMTYVCRSARGAIQKDVTWSNDGGLVMEGLTAKLRLPDSHTNAGDPPMVIDCGDHLTETHVLDCKIPPEYRVDGLRVEVTATYTVERDGIHSWRMPTSTRNFYLSIQHPPRYDVELEAFTPDSHLVIQNKLGNDRVTCESSAWMLPDTGVAWCYVVRGQEAVSSVTPSLSA